MCKTVFENLNQMLILFTVSDIPSMLHDQNLCNLLLYLSSGKILYKKVPKNENVPKGVACVYVQ